MLAVFPVFWYIAIRHLTIYEHEANARPMSFPKNLMEASWNKI